MRIGELAGKIGVDAETIRYYEKKGLLPAPARSANGYRRYGSTHAERLAFIRHCRALDMSLGEIEALLLFVDSPTRDCAHVDDLVDNQLARVRSRLKSMRALERQLVALRQQCESPRPARICGILGELVAAAHGEACVCHTEARTATESGVRRVGANRR